MNMDHRGRVVSTHPFAQPRVNLQRVRRLTGRCEQSSNSAPNCASKAPREREERRLPPTDRRDTRKAPVVQLVTAVRREMKVLRVDLVRNVGEGIRRFAQAGDSASLTGPRDCGSELMAKPYPTA
jgi:hypothetical protein